MIVIQYVPDVRRHLWFLSLTSDNRYATHWIHLHFRVESCSLVKALNCYMDTTNNRKPITLLVFRARKFNAEVWLNHTIQFSIIVHIALTRDATRKCLQSTTHTHLFPLASNYLWKINYDFAKSIRWTLIQRKVWSIIFTLEFRFSFHFALCQHCQHTHIHISECIFLSFFLFRFFNNSFSSSSIFVYRMCVKVQKRVPVRRTRIVQVMMNPHKRVQQMFQLLVHCNPKRSTNKRRVRLALKYQHW